MKFHDRPELQMRVNEGNEITAQGMLSARCACFACLQSLSILRYLCMCANLRHHYNLIGAVN